MSGFDTCIFFTANSHTLKIGRIQQGNLSRKEICWLRQDCLSWKVHDITHQVQTNLITWAYDRCKCFIISLLVKGNIDRFNLSSVGRTKCLNVKVSVTLFRSLMSVIFYCKEPRILLRWYSLISSHLYTSVSLLLA